eukprot:8869927-Pyramimonas_sp.AAC.1
MRKEKEDENELQQQEEDQEKPEEGKEGDDNDEEGLGFRKVARVWARALSNGIFAAILNSGPRCSGRTLGLDKHM